MSKKPLGPSDGAINRYQPAAEPAQSPTNPDTNAATNSPEIFMDRVNLCEHASFYRNQLTYN